MPEPWFYLSRRIVPVRDRSLDVSAKARQDDGANRRPNVRVGYAEGVFINKVGLCGETIIMLWTEGLGLGKWVRWWQFKKGQIYDLPDIECGAGWHTIIEVKTNEFVHRINYLLVHKIKDLPPDQSRDHWIFVHCFIVSYLTFQEKDAKGNEIWLFTCPMVVNTGWCFGWEVRLLHDPNGKVDPKNVFNVPESALRPMYELERLIKLRERYGAADGELKWERGERI